MIFLNEFVDFIKVMRIKMVAFYAKMLLDRFGKELRFVIVSLGDFVRMVAELDNRPDPLTLGSSQFCAKTRWSWFLG